jgi:hypothetical protein
MSYQNAVARTQAYSAYFSFPLTPAEIHYWLISSHQAPLKSLQPYLTTLNSSDQKLRKKLAKNSQQKIKLASKLVKIARFLPGIKLIALTGSVAVGNTYSTDDIDLLIITAPYTLWLIRPFFLLLLTFKFRRRHPGDRSNHVQDSFCPNLWLDMTSLALPKNKRNLYTAHEVLQIKPLYDRGEVYQSFIQANRWTSHFLANAYFDLVSKSVSSAKSNSLDFIFLPLNILAYLFQYLYMLPKKTTELVNLHSAFFHKTDLSHTLERHLRHNCL